MASIDITTVVIPSDLNQTAKTLKRKTDENREPATTFIPPDGGYGYVIVMVAFVSNMFADGIDYSFGSLKDSMYDYCKGNPGAPELSHATLAWIGSLLTGPALLIGPLVSAAVNKFGFRAAAVFGSLVSSAAFISTWYLNKTHLRVELVIALYGVTAGIGISGFYIPAQIAVGFYFDKKRALATGIAVCGSGVGISIFPQLVTWLATTYEWHGAVLGLGLLIPICGVLGLLYKPLNPQSLLNNARDINTDYTEAVVHDIVCIQNDGTIECHKIDNIPSTGNTGGSQTSLLDLSLLLSPVFIVFAMGCMFTTLSVMVPFVYLMNQAEYALSQEDILSDKNTLSWLISLIGIAGIFGRIFIGWLADRPCINVVTLYNVGVTLMGVSTVAVPYLSQYSHFVGYSCVFGVSYACFISLKSIVLVELFGLDKLTDAFGLLLFFQGVASIASTPLAGVFVQMVGNKTDFSVSFFGAGAFFLLAAVMCYPLNKIHKWHTGRGE